MTRIDPDCKLSDRDAVDAFLAGHQDGDVYMVKAHPTRLDMVQRYRGSKWTGEECITGPLTHDEARTLGVAAALGIPETAE